MTFEDKKHPFTMEAVVDVIERYLI
jgi:hypothetical protein